MVKKLPPKQRVHGSSSLVAEVCEIRVRKMWHSISVPFLKSRKGPRKQVFSFTSGESRNDTNFQGDNFKVYITNISNVHIC